MTQELKWWRKMEWWPCWIGMLGFFLVDIITQMGFLPPGFNQWIHIPLQHVDQPGVLIVLLIFCFFSSWMAVYASQQPDWKLFPFGFAIILILAFISKVLASQQEIHALHIGDSIWAILFGLVLVNVIFPPIIPSWFKVAQQTELYIATSLVLLLIDFEQLAKLGPRALAISWLDTPILTILMSLVGFKFMGMVLSDAVILCCTTMVCGTSAAIAITAAMHLPKKNSEVSILISSLLTVPAIVILPALAQGLKMNAYEAGGWIGGVIDSTGGVIATATIFSNTDALTASAIVKMTQNILIAPMSLAVSVLAIRYPTCFAPREESLLANNHIQSQSTVAEEEGLDVKKALYLLWERFPKFVLAFLSTAILFNLIVTTSLHDNCRNTAFYLAEWFSTCSFISIGTSLKISNLPPCNTMTKFLILYLITQTLDILVTGGLATLFFHDSGSSNL